MWITNHFRAKQTAAQLHFLYSLFHLCLVETIVLSNEDSVNNKLFMKTCLKSHLKLFLRQLSLLDSIENKRVEVSETKKIQL